MKQINGSFLGCLNLAVSDKFQYTRVLRLNFLLMMEKGCSTRQQQQEQRQQLQKRNEPIKKLIETQ